VIPSVEQILEDLVAGKVTLQQAYQWISEHITIAESKVTINIPALDRLVDVIKEHARA
jgi:hypothetical protein